MKLQIRVDLFFVVIVVVSKCFDCESRHQGFCFCFPFLISALTLRCYFASKGFLIPDGSDVDKVLLQGKVYASHLPSHQKRYAKDMHVNVFILDIRSKF